jgi:hypothetical protein
MSAHVVFIIRTYAFAGRNKFILAFLVAGWMALLGSYLWTMITKWTFPVELASLYGNSPCFGIDHPSRQSGGNFEHYKPISNAMLTLATFLFDSLMTAIVFIYCIQFRNLWGQLVKVFVVQGLMAYVFLSALNLAFTIQVLMPHRQWDGLGMFRGLTSCIIACRLILALRRTTDPTATTQVRMLSQAVQDAIVRLEATERAVIDNEEKDHHQPLERWD